MDNNEKFIIGLGNPGKEYIKNRHNIGFLLLENFSEKYDSKFTLKNKLKSWYSEFKINNFTYRLFMPNTFCLLYTSPSPRDRTRSRMPSSA